MSHVQFLDPNVSLDNKVCQSLYCAEYVYLVETVGNQQFNTFQKKNYGLQGNSTDSANIEKQTPSVQVEKEKKKPANKLKVEHFKQQPKFFGKKNIFDYRSVEAIT